MLQCPKGSRKLPMSSSPAKGRHYHIGLTHFFGVTPMVYLRNPKCTFNPCSTYLIHHIWIIDPDYKRDLVSYLLSLVFLDRLNIAIYQSIIIIKLLYGCHPNTGCFNGNMNPQSLWLCVKTASTPVELWATHRNIKFNSKQTYYNVAMSKGRQKPSQVFLSCQM